MYKFVDTTGIIKSRLISKCFVLSNKGLRIDKQLLDDMVEQTLNKYESLEDKTLDNIDRLIDSVLSDNFVEVVIS